MRCWAPGQSCTLRWTLAEWPTLAQGRRILIWATLHAQPGGVVVMRRRRVAGLLVALLAVPACAPKVKRQPLVRAAPPATEWPRPEVMELAERAWRCGWQSGEFSYPL